MNRILINTLIGIFISTLKLWGDQPQLPEFQKFISISKDYGFVVVYEENSDTLAELIKRHIGIGPIDDLDERVRSGVEEKRKEFSKEFKGKELEKRLKEYESTLRRILELQAEQFEEEYKKPKPLYDQLTLELTGYFVIKRDDQWFRCSSKRS